MGDIRQTHYDAWARTKIFLEPKIEKVKGGVRVSVEYKSENYSETFLLKDCFGTARPYNMAHNKLLVKMKNIDKDIEIHYDMYFK